MLIIVILAAVAATFFGGLFALAYKDRLHLILGFSAGAVLGVAFFDLLPEALALGQGYAESSTILALVGLGFLGYMLIDRTMSTHAHEDDIESHHHRGFLKASSFSVHSILDGVAIGIGFQVSSAAGIIIALAVLTHDFSDGINTVSAIIKHHGTRAQAIKWLLVDSAAPAIGALSTLFFTLNAHTLGIVLALFAGFFLYIGASDLLPESYHRHRTTLTTFMTILGAAVLYVVIRIAEG